MKKLALALLVAAPMAASAKTVTVEVCGQGESPTQCQLVTYTVRPQGPAVIEKCMVPSGEAGYAPCATHVGIPKWLKALNDFFKAQGLNGGGAQSKKEIDQYLKAGG